MMPRVLVTGGAGQVGLALQRRAAGFWEMSAPPRESLDIASPAHEERLAKAVADMALVVNCAAYTAVDKAESEPEAAFAANRDGPGRLAAACATAGVPLIHLSTDYVFDGTLDRPYREDDAVNPLGAYGASKEAGERAIRERLDRHLILRTAWVYGPDRANFVKTMLRLGAERDRLRVVADQQGCPTAAADIADTLVVAGTALLAGKADGWGTYHLAGGLVGGEPATWHAFAVEIFRQAEAYGRRAPAVDAIATADYPTPARRPANSVLDGTKLAQGYGITLPPWPESLAACLKALLGETTAA